jgi:hypothetical protein
MSPKEDVVEVVTQTVKEHDIEVLTQILKEFDEGVPQTPSEEADEAYWKSLTNVTFSAVATVAYKRSLFGTEWLEGFIVGIQYAKRTA